MSSTPLPPRGLFLIRRPTACNSPHSLCAAATPAPQSECKITYYIPNRNILFNPKPFLTFAHAPRFQPHRYFQQPAKQTVPKVHTTLPPRSRPVQGLSASLSPWQACFPIVLPWFSLSFPFRNGKSERKTLSHSGKRSCPTPRHGWKSAGWQNGGFKRDFETATIYQLDVCMLINWVLKKYYLRRSI